jgi:hydrogenase/urease accessory protein HupE
LIRFWPAGLARRLIVPLLLGWALLLPMVLSAHELLPGYLELHEQHPGSYAVIWKLPLQQGQRLPLAPRFPEGCAIQSALEREQQTTAWLYRTQLQCSPSLNGQTIAIDGLSGVSTDVLVRYRPFGGAPTQTALVKPEQPTVLLGGHQSGDRPLGRFTYLRLGIEHILLGVDHLLLLLGLVLIVRRGWMLLKTVTAFTVANSITLCVSAVGIVQIPAEPLNATIALSILFIGVEVVRSLRGQTSFTIRKPWVLACGFGLLHGFGYARGLAELGLPRHELLIALLLFNVGIEIGQDIFVALVLLLQRAFRQLEIQWPWWARRFPAYGIGCAGAYWTIEHTTALFASGGR